MHHSNSAEGVLMDVSSMHDYTQKSMILLNNIDETNRKLHFTIQNQAFEIGELRREAAEQRREAADQNAKLRHSLSEILAEVCICDIMTIFVII